MDAFTSPVFKTGVFGHSAISAFGKIQSIWCTGWDSNTQPTVLETTALPIELHPYIGAPNGNCTSNTFGVATQCYEFSLFIAYLLTNVKISSATINASNDGANLSGWILHRSNLTALTLEPGDIVRGSGHSAVGKQML